MLADEVVELARIPAPTFSEGRRLAWLERRLEGSRGERRRDAAGNLVWTWGEGRPRLLLLAHVDTVFSAGTDLEIERSDDALVGPGVGDNAAAIVVTLRVVEALLDGLELASGAVAFTVGEEGLGNLRGARTAVDGLAPAAVIAVEGHGLEEVVVDAVGSVRVRIAVTGPGGHSWVDRGNPSATHAILALGARLAASGSPDAPVNVGLLSGGTAVNAIASSAQLVAEKRALDEAVLADFEAALGRLVVDPPLELRLEALGRRPAGRLDRGSTLLAVVRKAREALGLPDALGAASTDANVALARGIPALTLGVATGSGMHTPGERIEIASLELGRRQLEAVVTTLLAA